MNCFAITEAPAFKFHKDSLTVAIFSDRKICFLGVITVNIIKLFFSYEGRIKRLPFLIGQIVIIVITRLSLYYSGVMDYLIKGDYLSGNMQGFLEIKLFSVYSGFQLWLIYTLFILSMLVLIYSTVCLDMKRFRDIGHSPWFVLLCFVPIVNLVTLLYLLFWPSKKDVVPAV